MKKKKQFNIKKEHKNPSGGLSAKGRKAYNDKTGSNLKKGVLGKADTPQKKKRKGSFLTRHYSGEFNAKKPLKDDNGNPTRHALQATAWGEPIPKKKSDVKKLAGKGKKLLDQYQKSKKKK